MSAQIPIKNDANANDRAMAKVRADKMREVKAGHDGTWVAHPALIKIAMDIFDEHMKGPNQVSRGEAGRCEESLTRNSTTYAEKMYLLLRNRLPTRKSLARSRSKA